MNDPINENQQAMIERLKKAGIEHGVWEAWDKGIDHREDTKKFAKDLSALDWLFNDDYFCWKFGGDGDNGQVLSYTLDLLFELYDKESED